MRIAFSLEEMARIIAPDERHVVTIGNFDGVHMGHQELIRITRKKAAQNNVAPVLVTFDPHPVHVVRGGGPGILTPLARKLELLERSGLDATLVLPFTKELAAMSAEEFVRVVLAGVLRTRELVTGFNFALGKNRSGAYDTLGALGAQYGFSVIQVPPVVIEGETVSSTRIREHVRSGEMEKVALLLGRMHSIDGVVVHGQARGRKLGYPTANIDYGNVLLPPLGAYAAWLSVPGGDAAPRMCMTSVGTNPTFKRGNVTVEANVFDFSGDLYGKKVRLFFARRLRGEVRFQSADDLKARLVKDEAATRELLSRKVNVSFL